MKLSKNYIRENLVLCILILKELRVLKKGNLDFDKFHELEILSNGAAIFVCGGRPLYLSNKTIVIQKKFTVSELKGF